MLPNFTYAKCLLLTLCSLYGLCQLTSVVQACSSRTVPKPRPSPSSASVAAKVSAFDATAPPRKAAATTTNRRATPPTTTTTRTTKATTIATTPSTTTTTTTTTARPNITFPTYKCPATYDAWYCLNEASCFSVKIGDSIMYNCECANGFMGPRCEYKELDGSYLPKRPRPLLEKASIASGATLALLFMLFVCLTLYLRYDQQQRSKLEALIAAEEFAVVEDDHVANDHRGREEAMATHCCCCAKRCGGGDGDGSKNNTLPETKSKPHKRWLRRVGAVRRFGDSNVGAFGEADDYAKAKHFIMDVLSMNFTFKRSAKM